MKVLRWLGWGLGALLLLVWVAWTTATLYYANLSQAGPRTALALGYLALLGGIAWRVRPRTRALRFVGVASGLVALAYLLQRPSNDRDWTSDVAVAPTVEVDGDRVTVRGVRNFRYRSATDYDARWEDRTYDLSKLRSLDLFMIYWGPVEYCHTILSFDFEGGEPLAVSVETRKEKGEGFSTFGGFFKQFELIYIFGDERDLIGLRTNHRREQVYLYHLRTQPGRPREIFLAYARFADELARRPEFYDTIENSCGVNIVHRVAEAGQTVFKGRDALYNGYWDRLLYGLGGLDKSLPFEELRAKSLINERAQAAGDSPDFSRRIREGLPIPPPVAGR
ncbi:MAG: DUF4105 domain-containing protein [Planctomycetes bacterium]|nr:DUF4105 domain-containing protein [Planctomycetota bacterium]